MAGLSREELQQVLSEAWNSRGEDVKEQIANLVDERKGESITVNELPLYLLTVAGKISGIMVTEMAEAMLDVISANNEALRERSAADRKQDLPQQP